MMRRSPASVSPKTLITLVPTLVASGEQANMAQSKRERSSLRYAQLFAKADERVASERHLLLVVVHEGGDPPSHRPFGMQKFCRGVWPLLSVGASGGARGRFGPGMPPHLDRARVRSGVEA